MQEITSPDFSGMIAQERRPVLPLWTRRTPRSHVFLDRSFTHANTQLEQLASDALRSPEPIIACHLLDQIVSGEILGRLESAFDVCFQKKRKRSRCHRSKVSGCTMKSACFQVRSILARSTKRNLSVFLQGGRLACRRRMMSCCRNNAFSTTSSDFPLGRSATVPSTREVEQGFIQRTRPTWSA